MARNRQIQFTGGLHRSDHRRVVGHILAVFRQHPYRVPYQRRTGRLDEVRAVLPLHAARQREHRIQVDQSQGLGPGAQRHRRLD